MRASYNVHHTWLRKPPLSLIYIVTCTSVARQRLGKHASAIERLFSMWSAPRQLLCNGAINTSKPIRDNRRRCFPWGPCKVIIKKNSIGQHRVKRRVSRRQPARIWAWNWIESSVRNLQLQNGKKGIRLWKKTSCVIQSDSETSPSPGYA
jgi:hypothetical protein